MFWTIILILFISMVIFLLLVPVILHINTNMNQYYLQIWGVAKASVEGDEEELIRIRLKIFFLNYSFYPLKRSDHRNKKSTGSRVKKGRRRIDYRTGIRLLKSFKVNRFLLDIDPGDCIYNAKLYPLFAFLNHYIGGFYVNFSGRNQLVLRLQNRPLYIIKSFIY